MFGFLNLDPVIMTQFWIYCIGFFIVGAVVGWIVRVKLIKASTDNLKSEKKKFETEREALLEIKKKYDNLCEEVKNNDDF